MYVVHLVKGLPSVHRPGLFFPAPYKLGVVEHNFNASTWETETRSIRGLAAFSGQPERYKILFQYQRKNRTNQIMNIKIFCKFQMIDP